MLIRRTVKEFYTYLRGGTFILVAAFLVFSAANGSQKSDEERPGFCEFFINSDFSQKTSDLENLKHLFSLWIHHQTDSHTLQQFSQSLESLDPSAISFGTSTFDAQIANLVQSLLPKISSEDLSKLIEYSGVEVRNKLKEHGAIEDIDTTSARTTSLKISNNDITNGLIHLTEPSLVSVSKDEQIILVNTLKTPESPPSDKSMAMSLYQMNGAFNDLTLFTEFDTTYTFTNSDGHLVTDHLYVAPPIYPLDKDRFLGLAFEDLYFIIEFDIKNKSSKILASFSYPKSFAGTETPDHLVVSEKVVYFSSNRSTVNNSSGFTFYKLDTQSGEVETLAYYDYGVVRNIVVKESANGDILWFVTTFNHEIYVFRYNHLTKETSETSALSPPHKSLLNLITPTAFELKNGKWLFTSGLQTPLDLFVFDPLSNTIHPTIQDSNSFQINGISSYFEGPQELTYLTSNLSVNGQNQLGLLTFNQTDLSIQLLASHPLESPLRRSHQFTTEQASRHFTYYQTSKNTFGILEYLSETEKLLPIETASTPAQTRSHFPTNLSRSGQIQSLGVLPNGSLQLIQVLGSEEN